MPQTITFLKAKCPLTKKIGVSSTQTYPGVKEFTSINELIESPKDLYKVIVKHADEKNCMAKGPIKEPIKNESRAGMINRTTPTKWLVFDIDGADVKVKNKTDLKAIAEKIIEELPEFTHETTYIVQASSSHGINNKVSIHIFFLLDEAIAPSILKTWLINLNFEIPMFHNNLQLTKTGWEVKYIMDICMADNARLLYIAPPEFAKGAKDPMGKCPRIVLVNKKHDTLATKRIIDEAARNTTDLKTKKIKALRKEAGLNAREKLKTRSLLINGCETQILMNPHPGSLIPSYIDRGFCYYNIVGGDSNAYYHPEGKPEIIYNFKNQLPFRWIDYDPEGYENYVANNALQIEKANPEKHFVVISKETDIWNKVIHNIQTDELRISETSSANAAHFYREHGDIMPETIPEWDIIFDPTRTERVDYHERWLNTYCPSDYIKNAVNLKQMPMIKDLHKTCPTIHNLLFHIVNNSIIEYTHFINWLGFILQEKRKTNTCWFFWGTQGTGKGLFYNYVLKPLFGESNVSMHLGTAMEDTFDSWRENKQLIVIDEFELPKGKAGDRMLERIKSWVAEEQNSVRGMHRAAVNKKGIEAYIFFSNKHEMIKVENGDRRFNIAPRQEKKIAETKFFNKETIIQQLEDELQTFANFMLNIKVSEYNAREALNNEAKQLAADATKTQADNFCDALTRGDFDFFVDVLFMTPEDVGMDINKQITLKNGQEELKRWLRHIVNTNEEPLKTTATNIRHVFDAVTTMTGTTPGGISKMLTRHGILSQHSSYNGKKGRFITLSFNTPKTLTLPEMQMLIKLAPGATIPGVIDELDETAND